MPSNMLSAVWNSLSGTVLRSPSLMGSSHVHTISVFNQLPRPTQPGLPRDDMTTAREENTTVDPVSRTAGILT